MPDQLDYVYGDRRIEMLRERYAGDMPILNSQELENGDIDLSQVQYIFSTWSMPELNQAQVERFEALEAIFYAAGSVQRFARPFLENGVRVFSAWQANAIPVAEFTLAQILLSCKGYFRNTRDYVDGQHRENTYFGPGIYENKVALIGFGMIAQKVAELLQPFQVELSIVDPFIDEACLEPYGAKLQSLEDAFSQNYVISNHLPNLPATVGLVGREHFLSMPDHASFINTGRGAQIREDEMIEVLQQRSDLTALLDVTYPEPPDIDSPLYTLPNVQLSTHIAGSINNEVGRMADYMMAEALRFQAGEPALYEVSMEMLKTMA